MVAKSSTVYNDGIKFERYQVTNLTFNSEFQMSLFMNACIVELEYHKRLYLVFFKFLVLKLYKRDIFIIILLLHIPQYFHATYLLFCRNINKTDFVL